MHTTYTEQSYENSVIEIFQNMGYTHVYGPDIKNRDFYSPLYEDVLEDSIYRINPSVPKAAIQEALLKIKNFDNACFLCSEETPEFCHRRLLVEYLKKHSTEEIKIIHLV